MSRKLSRYITEIEKTERKIEELKEYLSELRRKQKLDEDMEIIKRIRGVKMSSRELAEILDGIQEGTVSFQSLPQLEGDEDGNYTEDSGSDGSEKRTVFEEPEDSETSVGSKEKLEAISESQDNGSLQNE